MKFLPFSLKHLGMLCAAFASLATVRAVPVTFNFDGSGGLAPSYVFNSGGVSVTVTAASWDGSLWRSASVGQYSGGLGVTNSSGSDGGSPQHAVDNNGWKDYLILQFSGVVDVGSVALGWVSGDSDFTYRIGGSLTSVRSTVGGTSVNGGSSSASYSINAGNTADTFFSLAANPGGSNDYFKLNAVTVDTTTRVPDHGSTVVLLGVALVGLGTIFTAQRRQSGRLRSV